MSETMKFLRLPAVMEAVGMSRTTIYKRVKAGTFPKPVQLGLRSVAWDQAEVAAWQQSLARGIKRLNT
jgi:prophage regulatory protein